jgi:hypothetical protein
MAAAAGGGGGGGAARASIVVKPAVVGGGGGGGGGGAAAAASSGGVEVVLGNGAVVPVTGEADALRMAEALGVDALMSTISAVSAQLEAMKAAAAKALAAQGGGV